MSRIALVAARDFIATVSRKGFLFGILLMPVLGVGLSILVPKLLEGQAPQVQGEVRILDQSGQVGEALKFALTPEAITARRDARRKQLLAEVPELDRKQPLPGQAPPPKLRVIVLAQDAGLDPNKAALKRGEDGRA